MSPALHIFLCSTGIIVGVFIFWIGVVEGGYDGEDIMFFGAVVIAACAGLLIWGIIRAAQPTDPIWVKPKIEHPRRY